MARADLPNRASPPAPPRAVARARDRLGTAPPDASSGGEQLTSHQMSDAVYFTAPDGVVYRLLDSTRRGGKRLVANLHADWTTTRSMLWL